MATVETMLKIAQGYLGSTNGDFFIKKYNVIAGTNIPLGSSWCACGLSVNAYEAGVPASEAPLYSGAITGMNLFKKLGKWQNRSGYTPTPGNHIFFDWNPSENDGNDHVGLVERVTGGRVYTIEYNTGSPGTCMRRDYALTSTVIVGYGTPVYETESNLETEEEKMDKQTFAKHIEAYLDDLSAKNTSQWSEEARMFVEENGIIIGDKTGRKNYRGFVTREELTVVVYRLYHTAISAVKKLLG